MQEQSRYAVGIDVGTTMIRCVVGHVDTTTGTPTIVGVGEYPNSGMRKGSVSNLNGPSEAIDKALGDAERMSGYQVNDATVSINGSHILSTRTDGMIAVGMSDHEVNEEDLYRIEDVATTGKVPANRKILKVVPFNYTLDGQGGIKDPLGMTGTRLEISANVVSAMAPYVANLEKAVEGATVRPNDVVPSVMAAATAVLDDSQMENGVAVIDLGGATTGVAVYEEGDLQYVGVVPYGGVNVTNDLAIGLKIDPEIAEKVKLQHASAVNRNKSSKVTVKHDKETLEFDIADIDEIVEARLEEIFEAVNKELEKAGRAGRLPSGAVLAGGASNMKSIVDFAKNQLGVAVRRGKAKGYGGVVDNVNKPEFAAAIGLMLADINPDSYHSVAADASKTGTKSGGFLSSLFNRFRP
mgnify:FL=1